MFWWLNEWFELNCSISSYVIFLEKNMRLPMICLDDQNEFLAMKKIRRWMISLMLRLMQSWWLQSWWKNCFLKNQKHCCYYQSILKILCELLIILIICKSLHSWLLMNFKNLKIMFYILWCEINICLNEWVKMFYCVKW